MHIQKSICPRCGAPTQDALCPRCRVEETRWLSCEARVEAIYCPVCDSTKQGKTWTDLAVDREDLIRQLAHSAVKLHPDVKDPRMEIWTEDVSPNRTACTIEVHAMLYGLSVHDTCRVEIVWRKEQCDRCNRISGGYYEGVVQVRATGRKMSAYELSAVERIATEAEDAMQAAGERLSFVSSTDLVHDGVDVTIGSQHIGQVIVQRITSELGGKTSTHPKLVGEKEGRTLYRITYLVRLPFYQKGDVVEVKNTYFEIRKVEPQYFAVYDLKRGVARTIREDEIERRVGSVRDAEEAIVAFTSGNIVGILDPKTFITRGIAAVPWLYPAEGAPIRVLRDTEKDELIMIG